MVRGVGCEIGVGVWVDSYILHGTAKGVTK